MSLLNVMTPGAFKEAKSKRFVSSIELTGIESDCLVENLHVLSGSLQPLNAWNVFLMHRPTLRRRVDRSCESVTNPDLALQRRPGHTSF